METKVMIFTCEQFGQIRCMKDDKGNPWFVGKDVAEKLGYKDASKALCDHVDKEDKTSLLIQQSGSNYKAKTCFINESGLYSLILSSKLPQAKEFKHWVTAVVLPQIRQTGGYIPLTGGSSGSSQSSGGKAGVKGLSDEEIMAKALVIAQKTIELKDKILEEQRPKVLFADAVSKSVDSILVRDLAKLITQNGVEIGAGRLFYWLRLNHYLFQDPGRPRPRQEWVERGLFEVCVRTYQVGSHTFESITTRVTGKGQQYFVNGFLTGRFCAENGNFKG